MQKNLYDLQPKNLTFSRDDVGVRTSGSSAEVEGVGLDSAGRVESTSGTGVAAPDLVLST